MESGLQAMEQGLRHYTEQGWCRQPRCSASRTSSRHHCSHGGGRKESQLQQVGFAGLGSAVREETALAAMLIHLDCQGCNRGRASKGGRSSPHGL